MQIRETDNNEDECWVHYHGFSNNDNTWIKMDKVYKNNQENRDLKADLVRIYKQKMKAVKEQQKKRKTEEQTKPRKRHKTE
jgi:hypothetical protein